MKKIIIISVLFFLFKPHQGHSQTLVAHYAMTEEIFGGGPFEGKKLATLESEGYFYKLGGRYLYYERPGYLKKYPDGNITILTNGLDGYSYALCTDTLQRIYYTNMDSLSRVFRPHFTGRHDQNINYVQKYEAEKNSL